jgi:Kef-type K+ transport system membrane component KefB
MFSLFMGTAMPVLARMLTEWGIARTRLACVAISAAVSDAAGWVLLAVVAALMGPSPGSAPWLAAGMALGLAAFASLLIFVAGPLLSASARRMMGAASLGPAAWPWC